MIYLLYAGNFDALTGGYIYNKRIIDYLRKNQIDVGTIQLDALQSLTSEKEILKNERLIRTIPDNSILLIDSLVFASQRIFRTRYNPSHIVIPVVHLPLFLNPDFHLITNLKSTEIAAYKMASHIIVTSLFTKKILMGEGLEDAIISIVNPGIDPIPVKTNYPLLPEKLLYVSNLCPNKNQLMLLHVLTRIKNMNWTLTLAGSPDMDSGYTFQVKQFLKENNLQNRVHLIGSVQGSKLHDIYTDADLFLFPGIFETYGMVIAEALTTGLPVLANVSEGIKLNFGNHCLRYFKNEDELEISLKDVLTNADSYAKFQTAASHHPVFSSWEIAGMEFLQILKRFL